VTEGLNLGSSAETSVAEGFQSNDMLGVKAASDEWALNWKPTKYVSNITINAGTGVITIDYNPVVATGGIPQLVGANKVVLSPFIAGAPLATTLSGNIDWACTSAGNTTATGAGYGAAVLGTVLTKYVPTQCK